MLIGKSKLKKALTLLLLLIFIFNGLAIGQTRKNAAQREFLNELTRQINRSIKQKPNTPRQKTAKINIPKTEEEFEGDQEKREDWFISQRAYPFNEIPDNARYQAWLSRPPITPAIVKPMSLSSATAPGLCFAVKTIRSLPRRLARPATFPRRAIMIPMDAPI
jgi:hypothetical protein